ncbi:hypothetical protein MWU63_09580 [Pseudohalocynthiibacter sp. F2068]|jgi:hypothetical protein|nr:hypothetical protein [Pseudohalocynthiibacter sp. F2068]
MSFLPRRCCESGYVHRYPYQFTIRARVTSGAETELSKIVNGKGDWMFYGHSNERQDGFALWWLIDLNAFRAALIRQTANGYSISCGDMANSDGTCFKWFDIRSFPTYPPLVVACSYDYSMDSGNPPKQKQNIISTTLKCTP